MASRSFSKKEIPEGERSAYPDRSRAKRLLTHTGEVGKEDAEAIITKAGLVARGAVLPGGSGPKHNDSSDRFSIRLGSGRGIEGCRIPMGKGVFAAIEADFDRLKQKMLLRKEVSRAFRITLEHTEVGFILNIAGHRERQVVECAVLKVEHMKYDSEMSRLEANAVLEIVRHEILNRAYDAAKTQQAVKPEATKPKIRPITIRTEFENIDEQKVKILSNN